VCTLSARVECQCACSLNRLERLANGRHAALPQIVQGSSRSGLVQVLPLCLIPTAAMGRVVVWSLTLAPIITSRRSVRCAACLSMVHGLWSVLYLHMGKQLAVGCPDVSSLPSPPLSRFSSSVLCLVCSLAEFSKS
jgi:hypothetical protein